MEIVESPTRAPHLVPIIGLSYCLSLESWSIDQQKPLATTPWEGLAGVSVGYRFSEETLLGLGAGVQGVSCRHRGVIKRDATDEASPDGCFGLQ